MLYVFGAWIALNAAAAAVMTRRSRPHLRHRLFRWVIGDAPASSLTAGEGLPEKIIGVDVCVWGSRNLMIPLPLLQYETAAHHLRKEGRRDHLDHHGLLHVRGHVVRALSQ
jgi:hypothetical protein